jgi:hypothetical protein
LAFQFSVFHAKATKGAKVTKGHDRARYDSRRLRMDLPRKTRKTRKNRERITTRRKFSNQILNFDEITLEESFRCPSAFSAFSAVISGRMKKR